MNQTTHQQHAAQAVTMGFSSLESFEFMQRTAKMFSASTMVPTAYQAATIKKAYNKPDVVTVNPAALANCVIALDMSQRMNANPLMIMQNLHIIEGRPSWSSQFIIAAINNCGKFSPLRFEIEKLGEMDAKYTTYEWVNNNKIPQHHTVRIDNMRCVAWATEKGTGQRLESAPVTMEMAVAEGWYSKNGSKWQSMPELMMRYRSAAFFGRIYAPELLMGLPAAEELHDVFSVDQDGMVSELQGQRVPPSTGTVDPETGEVNTNYPQAEFEKKMPGWAKTIAAGTKTMADLIAFVSSKGTLTQEQQAALAAEVQRLQANTVDVVTQAATPAAEPQPVQAAAESAPAAAPAAGPVITFAQVNTKLASAKNLDALFEAGDLIGEVQDPQHRAELTAIFDGRQQALGG